MPTHSRPVAGDARRRVRVRRHRPRHRPGCAELNYTTGATGTIQPTTFAIPQLAFKEPTTAAEVISRANAYHGWDWMVWEGRTFYFVPAASGVQWQARQSDGASLQLEGDAADQVINGVVVAYTDNGTHQVRRSRRVRDGHRIQRASGHVERQSVQRALPDRKRWPVLQMSVPTTDAGAVEVGALYLQERNIAARRGSISVTGSIRHPTEGLVPVWRIRAGDTITVSDVPGGVVRRIISVSYQHSTRTAQLELVGSRTALRGRRAQPGPATGPVRQASPGTRRAGVHRHRPHQPRPHVRYRCAAPDGRAVHGRRDGDAVLDDDADRQDCRGDLFHVGGDVYDGGADGVEHARRDDQLRPGAHPYRLVAESHEHADRDKRRRATVGHVVGAHLKQ
jgi:hypothetical protein